MPLAEDQNMIQTVVPKRSIKRSAYGFCQGDLGYIGWSRIPIVRTRRRNGCP